MCRGPPIAVNNALVNDALIEKGETMDTLNVWCTRFHAALTLSFLDPVRKQQQHAEACIGGNDDYDCEHPESH